ncbi:MAG: methionyl-tRNA formyltransferase [bacterium]
MDSKEQIKTIFIGTGNFAAIILNDLIQNPFLDITLVITSPDKPSGRQQKISISPVKQIAIEKQFPILQPDKISETEKYISQLNPDINIIADYGQIIPENILDIPKYKSINIHPSLLPKYRGASPIQTTIINSDKKTGTTIILMDKQMDHGPIIAQQEIEIKNNETTTSLEIKLAHLSNKLIRKKLPLYIKNKIKPQPQDETLATYTKKIAKEDGQIYFNKETTKKIIQKMRGLSPWPGLWAIINNKRIKIINAKKTNQQPNNRQLIFKTKDGFIELKSIQPEGKKIMTGEDFLRGMRN